MILYKFLTSVLILMISFLNVLCQDLNRVDSLGMKQGLWYYEVMKDSVLGLDHPLISCHFKNDTLDGEYILYSKGTPILFLNYEMGKKNGMQKLYSKTMTPMEIDLYEQDKILVKIYFYSNGAIEKEEQYEDGLLNGISRRYYQSGKLWMAMEYENGKLNGDFIHFNKKGRTFMVEKYEKGILIDTILK